MDMKMVTLENGLRAVVADKPAASPESSAFAEQLAQVAQAAQQAQAAGSTKLQAAWSSLTPGSRDVLERLRAAQERLKAAEDDEPDAAGAEGPGITTEEWNNLCRELHAMGLLTNSELFHANPDIIVVGKLDPNGSPAAGLAELNGMLNAAPNIYWEDISWNGDPLQFFKRWLDALYSQRELLNGQLRPDGAKYDTSFLTRQIEDKEKVSDLVASLLECC